MHKQTPMSASGTERPNAHLTEPPFVAETLAWCNERRAEDGKDPLERLPLGRRSEGASCPCGKATGWYVDYAEAIRLGVRQDLPEGVKQFVGAFDDGELPQYDEARADMPSVGAPPGEVA